LKSDLHKVKFEKFRFFILSSVGRFLPPAKDDKMARV